MSERYGVPRRTLSAFLILICAVALAASSAKFLASARASDARSAELAVPNSFRLQASNGYTLLVIGEPQREGRRWPLQIIAYTKNQGVLYQVPATVTETSIHADLGALGEISVSFQRSNRAISIPCLGKTIRFDSGEYVGTIIFHGEEGYADAESTTAHGDVDYLLGGVCGHGLGIGNGSTRRRRGVVLNVQGPHRGPQLRVAKGRPGAAALINASLSEYSDGISIKRITRLRMPGDDFTYDPRLRSATVQPPSPFAGSARFVLGKKARWRGDLTVDLPGRADVPLTGPMLRANLALRGSVG